MTLPGVQRCSRSSSLPPNPYSGNRTIGVHCWLGIWGVGTLLSASLGRIIHPLLDEKKKRKKNHPSTFSKLLEFCSTGSVTGCRGHHRISIRVRPLIPFVGMASNPSGSSKRNSPVIKILRIRPVIPALY